MASQSPATTTLMTASNNGDSTTHPLANDHRHNNHNHAGQPPSNNSVPNGLSAPSNLDQNHAGAMAAAAAPAVSAPPLAAPTTITTTITTSTTTNAANNSAPTPLRRPSASEMTAETYQFPISRLRRRQRDAGRTPIVLVACGSFSPITFLHLRMFSLALDYIRFNTNFEVVGSYLSPVNDTYKKAGLAPASHRIKMAELAERTSDFIMVDPWEAVQPSYTPTAKVLDHFDREINDVLGGVEMASGEGRRRVRIVLLAGADLIETMGIPGLWSPEDISHILVKYGAFIIERAGSSIEQAMRKLKPEEVRGVHYIRQVISNDVSSTKVRNLLKSDMSIDYLIPAEVIKYIKESGLYQDTANSR